MVGLDYANPYMHLGTSSADASLALPYLFIKGAPTRSFSASSSILESRPFSRFLGGGRGESEEHRYWCVYTCTTRTSSNHTGMHCSSARSQHAETSNLYLTPCITQQYSRAIFCFRFRGAILWLPSLSGSTNIRSTLCCSTLPVGFWHISSLQLKMIIELLPVLLCCIACNSPLYHLNTRLTV